jgi:RES domain-containing protein
VIPTSSCSFPSTHRLIPSKYSPEGTVLSELADTQDDLLSLVELDGSTNSRLAGEAGLLPGIGIHELIFGVPYSHIVNASFTHASDQGGRFNSSARGAWYAGVEIETSCHEVAFHRLEDLREVSWPEEEVSTFDDYVAEFAAEFHDLRGGARAFRKYLKPSPVPACYRQPQQLANELLAQGSNGIVFPSVRYEKGTCLACFRPALVYNVRRAQRLEFRLLATKPFSMKQVSEIRIQ